MTTLTEMYGEWPPPLIVRKSRRRRTNWVSVLAFSCINQHRMRLPARKAARVIMRDQIPLAAKISNTEDDDERQREQRSIDEGVPGILRRDDGNRGTPIHFCR